MANVTDLLTRLRAAMTAGASNPAEARQILAELEAQIPDPVARLQAIRDHVLSGQGRPDGAARPASPVNWKYFIGLLGGVTLGGGTVAGFLKPEMLQQIDFSFKMPNIFALLGVAAGIGLVVGFAYSFYHNGWKIVLPTFSRDRANNTLAVTNWGFVDETAFAVVLAVLAVWAKSPPGDERLLLTPSTVLLAVAAAGLSARMRNGIWDRDMLREALTEAVKLPAASRALAAAVANAPTAAAAAAVATGKEVPGFNPPKLPEGVVAPAAVEADLLQLFDRDKLRARLQARGGPVGPDGDGLTLGTLAQFQPLVQHMKPFVEDMRVPEVAAMSPDDFLAAVARNGVELGEARRALTVLREAAAGVMAKLRSLPKGWEIRADRV